MPPQTSVAKFVRQSRPSNTPTTPTTNSDNIPVQSVGQAPGQDESRGKVTVGTGAAVTIFEGGDDPLLLLFPFEGGWTGWLGERYDLSISVNSFAMLGLEGNVAFVSNDFIRMGFLHGFQIGGVSALEEPGEGFIGFGGSAGLFFQTTASPKAAFFWGARYAGNTYMETGEGEIAEYGFHHAVWSLGAAVNSGRLQIIPELIMDTAFYAGGSDGREFYSFTIIPSITISANY